MKEKIVLAYSGGLDTSVAVQWLIDKGYDVVACCLDVGEGKDLDVVYQKALDMGAIECHIIDATKEFSEDYVSQMHLQVELHKDLLKFHIHLLFPKDFGRWSRESHG